MRQVSNDAVVPPLVQIAIGLVVGFIVLGIPMSSCGAAQQLTPVIRCKLEALRVLPKERRMLSPYDLEDIYDRVNACYRMGADGGAP